MTAPGTPTASAASATSTTSASAPRSDPAAPVAPAGLVGAALLLWGASIGLPWLGAVVGLGFEALRWAAPVPSPFSAAAPAAVSARRAAALLAPAVRLCALLALGSLVLFLVTQGPPQALYAWLRWSPLLLLPLAVLQLFIDRVGTKRLLQALRAGRSDDQETDRAIDLTHLLALLALAAAGTGAHATRWLYAGFVLVVGWALLARMPRARRGVGVAMLVLASGIGYATHLGIAALQGQVEEWSTDLIADWLSPPPDPFRERTRIGDLGKIKLSDRIVMRVSIDGQPSRPRSGEALLLRESVFDRYRSGEWQSARRSARPATRIDAGEGRGDWQVSEGPGTGPQAAVLSVRRSLPGGEGLLPLPLGAQRVHALPADTVDVLATGTVRARGTPRFIAMIVAYADPADGGRAAGAEAPDAAVDLEVPPLLAPVLARVIAEERLPRDAGAAATVSAVRGLFASKFAYSLNLGDARTGLGARTLADFLTRDRMGHCEYFATATVLLLRQAGVPARYVGGFSVQEYSEREQAFVVRARHAHAWAQAWVDGRWVQVDTTPSRWAELESEAARGAFGPLLDLVSWVADRALRAWQAGAGGNGMPIAASAAALLGVVLHVMILRLKMRKRRAGRGTGTAAARHDDIALAWANVEAIAARTGHTRAEGETARAWARRGHRGVDDLRGGGELRSLADRYYRVRFDPAATADDVREFLAAARRWSSSMAAAPRV